MNNTTPSGQKLERSLIIEIVRATEKAAIAAAKLRGRLDEMAADQAAIDALHTELNRLDITGTIIVGEGENASAAKLFTGESMGTGNGPECDVALDPLEGRTICAKNLKNSMSVIALASKGSLLNAPDVYMEKIAIGPGFEPGTVSLGKTAKENLIALAKAKNVNVDELSVCILDRQRHGKLIGEVNALGASIRLIGDGDLAGVINTTNPVDTGIDIYMGSGGAREGVLAAAALRCIGGQMQGRLMLNTREKLNQARELGIDDPDLVYNLEDMVRGDVMFAATGVSDGDLLKGVRFENCRITTNSLVMRSTSRTVREISTRHIISAS